MKQFVRQILCLSGVVVVRKGKVRQVKFNPLYPHISRIAIAFEALLTPYGTIWNRRFIVRNLGYSSVVADRKG